MSILYAVCPTGALSILGNNPDNEVSLADQLPHTEKVSNLIRWRRSVRRYKDENLTPELIDELLQTAFHAPTGVNASEVLFTVVRDKAFMEKLSKEMIERLAAVEAAGNMPEGFLGQYLALVVEVWKTEGRDIILRGAPHPAFDQRSKNRSLPCSGYPYRFGDI